MADEITDAERDAARATLQRQWELGVLDAGEHERRTTAVRHARTQAELERALRGAQPGSGMTGPVIPPFEPRSTRSNPPDSPDSPSRSAGATRPDGSVDDRTQGLLKLDRRTAGTVVALTPFVCAFLFFALDMPWWIFLLWFVMPILVYGKDGRDEHRAEQHERRARRHAAKAQRHRRKLEGR